MLPASAQAESLFNEGCQYMARHEAKAAQTCFRQAIAIQPNLGEAHANLAFLLDQDRHWPEAELAYRQAIALCHGRAEIHLNLGGLLCQLRRFDEAGECYLQALTLAPESAAVWCNLGVWHMCQQQEEQAENCYRHALALDAQHAKANFNLSYLLLRQGRFDEGWQRLESRDWYAGLAAHFECPRWQGEPLAGKSMVIGFEAGHGDMIQFARYAAVLKAQGASHITLLCHPALQALFSTLKDVDSVLAFSQDVPRSGWDYWTPPLSIPLYCKTTQDTIPAVIPYLLTALPKQAQWAAQLAQHVSERAPPDRKYLKVGLVWHGNPQFDNDSDRSIHDPSQLQPLLEVPGVQFFSLHPGFKEGLDSALPRVIPLGREIKDFTDTAAILVNLDLLISVDTAAAHLAGALGIPCWVLLPRYLTDWRWMKDRADSPWYPRTMRLFRQPEAGNWQPVISAVAQSLIIKMA